MKQIDLKKFLFVAIPSFALILVIIGGMAVLWLISDACFRDKGPAGGADNVAAFLGQVWTWVLRVVSLLLAVMGILSLFDRGANTVADRLVGLALSSVCILGAAVLCGAGEWGAPLALGGIAVSALVTVCWRALPFSTEPPAGTPPTKTA